MGELELIERAKETDALASPLLDAANQLMKWTADKTAEFKVGVASLSGTFVALTLSIAFNSAWTVRVGIGSSR